MNEFYRFQCEAGDEPTNAELLIFAAIGDWEDMGEVSAKAFARDLAALPKSVKRLDIHINSPGGSLFEASAIYSRLADHASHKVVYVDGLAASAASIVAMVGHKVYVRANANIMVHLPSGIVMGNADDMRKMAGALDTVTESMINIYAKRTGQERADLRTMLAEETWMTAEQAVENGFADEVRGVVKAAASVGEQKAMFNGAEFDLSRFRNVPAFSATTVKGKPMKAKKITAAAAEPPAEENDETPKPAPAAAPAAEPAPAATPEPAPAPEPAAAPAAALSEFEKGAKAERDRVMALQQLDRPATHAVVVAAIKDGKQPTDIIAACMAAMDKAAGQAARHADAFALNGIPASDGAEVQKEFGAKLKEKVAARLKTRRGRSPVNNRN